jgi:hypothetical protein
MKPATAAKKLEVLLDATPEEFRERDLTRSEYDALQADPPAWLVDLRRDGPHPRPVVAARLGVSISGLARGGVTEPLTSEQIGELLRDRPDWLVRERATHAEVMAENARVKRARRERAASA